MAPRSMRRRLCAAARDNDIVELKRLHDLDMASEADLLHALQRAIRSNSEEATAHLWKGVHLVRLAEPASSDNDEADEVDKEIDQAAVVRMVLESPNKALVRALARQHPQGGDQRIGGHAATNLLAVVRLVEPAVFYDVPANRSKLLDHTLCEVLYTLDDPWQGVQASVQELVEVHGVKITLGHVFQACLALDTRYSGAEEEAVLELLLDRYPPLGKDEFNQVLHQCCAAPSLGKALRVVLNSYEVNDEYGYESIFYTIHTGAWQSLEVLLDSFRCDDRLAAPLLLDYLGCPFSCHSTSPSFVRVLDVLLACVPADVTNELTCKLLATHASPGGVVDYMLARLLALHPEHLSSAVWLRLTREQALELVRRRSDLRAHAQIFLPHFSAWEHVIELQRAPTRDPLLAHTPLAAVLVELTLQYVA
jgi:hypothetical protein